MRSLPILLGLVVGLSAITAPAAGQTLAERIAAVKAKRARESARPRAQGPKVKMLQALMYTKLTVDFEQTPAREAFEYLRTALGVNLVVRYGDDAVGHGIDPETPVTLEMKEMPAVDVLELVLEQCASVEECTWQLRRSFVEVGTKERLSVPAAREMRVYPIDDLLFVPRRFDDAPPAGIIWDLPGFYGYGPIGDSYGGGYSGAISPGGSSPLITAPSGYNAYGADEHRLAEHAGSEGRAGPVLVDLITGTIEPNAWTENGGEWATIDYREGALVVHAPDYIHREINGYPPVPPPEASD